MQKNKAVNGVPMQEQNTYLVGGFIAKVPDTGCCKPVMMAWWPTGGSGIGLVGVRHVGTMCAGEFLRMPFATWKAHRP